MRASSTHGPSPAAAQIVDEDSERKPVVNHQPNPAQRTVPASEETTTPRPVRGGAVRDAAMLAIICLVGLLMRLPFLDMPMIADEGGYAYATRGWLDGTGELYHDLWISRPQGIFYLYALIFQTLGTDTIALRLAAWISACGTAVAVWAIARRWWPRHVAPLAALIFIVISGSPALEGYTANAEMFMMLPSAWSIWTLIKAIDTRWSARWLLLTGVLVGVATMLKPSGVVMMPVAIIAIVTMTRSARFRAWVRPAAWLLAGIALIGIPAIIHGWFLGFSEFLYATVIYRLTMQSTATVGLSHNLAALGRLLLRVLPLLLLIAAVTLIAHRRQVRHGFWHTLLAMPNRPRRAALRHARRVWRHAGEPLPVRHLTVPDDRVGMLLRLWVLAALTGIAMGGDWWPHYLIQIAAPFAIWFAALLLRALASLRQRLRFGMMTVATVVLLAPWWVVALGSTGAMSNQLFAHPGYQAQDEVATWIRAHSAPGASIFVAFDQAAIYYLADRPPAYRHLYDQELRAISSSYSDIISIIRSPKRPLFIISTRQPGPFPDESRTFWQEVGRYYELETMIEGVPIYRAREASTPANTIIHPGSQATHGVDPVPAIGKAQRIR